MAGLTSAGYLLGSIFFAWLGDLLFKKNSRFRSNLAITCNIIAIPLCVLMIFYMKAISSDLMPIYPDEIPADEIFFYIWLTLQSIFENYPTYWWYLVFSFLGTFFSAGMIVNKKAVMVDINLPEHRGTVTSFFQLTEQI